MERVLGSHNPTALPTEASSPGAPFPLGDDVGQSISELPLGCLCSEGMEFGAGVLLARYAPQNLQWLTSK